MNLIPTIKRITFLVIFSIIPWAGKVYAADSEPPESVYDHDGIFAGFSLVKHIGAGDRYNLFSPELNIAYAPSPAWQNLSLIAGIYYNGEYRASLYGGAQYDLSRYFDVKFGIVRGYQGEPVVPMAIIEFHPVQYFGFFFLPGAERRDNRLNFLPIIGVRTSFRLYSF